jgi:hypothetical protein
MEPSQVFRSVNVELVSYVSETVSVSIIRGLCHECCGHKLYSLEREFWGNMVSRVRVGL